MREIWDAAILIVVVAALILFVGTPLVWLDMCRRAFRLRKHAARLGAQLLGPFTREEIAQLTGTTTRIAWNIRVLDDYEDSEDERGHRLLWSTDLVRADKIMLVIGNGPHDADLSTWRADRLERDTWQRSSAYASAQAEFAELSRRLDEEKIFKEAKRDPVAAGRRLQALMERYPTKLTFGPPLVETFVGAGRAVALGTHLADHYHAFTVDDAVAARVLAPPADRLLQEWRKRYSHDDDWLRVWVGGPNLRLEARVAYPSPAAYRDIVELGVALARAFSGG